MKGAGGGGGGGERRKKQRKKQLDVKTWWKANGDLSKKKKGTDKNGTSK